LKHALLILFAGVSLSVAMTATPSTPVSQIKKVKWKKVGKKKGRKQTVWKVKKAKAFVFEAGMTIDADGSPKTYHPRNKGLDTNANGKYKGRWVSVVTIGRRPYIQKQSDPAPGYYVSTTSLQDPAKKKTDPARYVDSEKIPYIALPQKLLATGGEPVAGRAQLGDIALVINTNNGKKSFAVVADRGPSFHLGEGSIALARSLGINANARKGGIGKGIVYIVFPGSGDGRPKSVARINHYGEQLQDKWGKQLGL